MQKINTDNNYPLIKKHQIDISNLDVISKYSNSTPILTLEEKELICEKLLEAYALAKANVKAGNITKRGFATNICTQDNHWSLGTNFNNTRNDISSICGERSAIIKAYNEALIRHMNLDNDKEFNFKIKYLCMSSSIDLKGVYNFIVPCEDCLSWLNTNKYFNPDTLIFSFEKEENETLKITTTRLLDLLPYKNTKTSNIVNKNKKIKVTNKASDSIKEFGLKDSDINELINKTKEQYNQINYAKISNQNIAVSIISNNEIFTASKLDWTKRWHVEPLEFACYCAIMEQQEKAKIQAICYFGDEFSKDKNNNQFNDGVVSIKSLGRIRQKYANSNTILILNLDNEILITTIGEYLPKKFIQGYKIQ